MPFETRHLGQNGKLPIIGCLLDIRGEMLTEIPDGVMGRGAGVDIAATDAFEQFSAGQGVERRIVGFQCFEQTHAICIGIDAEPAT